MSQWQFADPPNVATITVKQIVEDGQPILLVCHDEDDGCWQFLTGSDFDVKDGLVILLKNMIHRDPSLNDLFDLPLGWKAWRSSRNDPWQRAPHE